MEKKTKLTISGSVKKSIKNIEIAKTQNKNSVVIEKQSTKFSSRGGSFRSGASKSKNTSTFNRGAPTKTTFVPNPLGVVEKQVDLYKSGYVDFKKAKKILKWKPKITFNQMFEKIEILIITFFLLKVNSICCKISSRFFFQSSTTNEYIFSIFEFFRFEFKKLRTSAFDVKIFFFFDLTPEDIINANSQILADSKERKIGEGTIIEKGAKIHENSIIGENCKISDGVIIGPNTSIGDNVIIENIDKSSSIDIENSIIMSDCLIKGSITIRQSIISSKCNIKRNENEPEDKILLLVEGTQISV